MREKLSLTNINNEQSSEKVVSDLCSAHWSNKD